MTETVTSGWRRISRSITQPIATPMIAPPAAATTNSSSASPRRSRRRPRLSAIRNAARPVASLISDSPWTSSRTRSGTRTLEKVATAATASVGATAAPSMNAAGHGRPSTHSWAATATALIVTSTSASASPPERAALGAQLARRRVPARGQQQRRDEDQQHDVRVELDLRHPRHEGQPEAAEHEHDRIRHADDVGGPHEQDRSEEQREEDLEFAHSRRESRIAAVLPPLSAEDHVDGPPDAPLELIMYGDFQCPYCTAAQSIVRRVRSRLDGRLRFAFRHLPLHEVHPMRSAPPRPPRPPPRRGASGRCTTRCTPTAGASRRGPGRAGGAVGTGCRALPRRADRRAYTARVARDADGGAGGGIASTPTFIVNGGVHTGSFDAGSLVEALTSDS